MCTPNNFLVKLPDIRSQHLQDFMSGPRQPIIPSRPLASVRIGLTLQPAKPFHAMEQGIQSAWTDFISMPPQLQDHPLAMERLLPGMMENVNLPEAQKDFALELFHNIYDGRC